MQRWLRRGRGMLGMGLAWAIGGLLVGGAIELLDNILPSAHGFTRLVDMWPQLLAMAGFISGAVFSVVLGVAASRHRFDELSVGRFAVWGALSGLLLGALAVATGGPVAFIAVTTLGSAIGGAASLTIARKAERRGLLGAGTPSLERAPNARLTGRE